MNLNALTRALLVIGAIFPIPLWAAAVSPQTQPKAEAAPAEYCTPEERARGAARCQTTKTCAPGQTQGCVAHPGQAQSEDTLGRVTVVGTRIGIDVARYPGSASVVTPEELQSSPDVLKSLQNVPGVDIGDDLGRALGQGFTIRGFGHGSENRVILMQDGVRRSSNLFSNQVSGLGMDSDLLKQVDVVRGSSGISYGGGAIGGVINSTTKDAADFIRAGHAFGGTANYRHDTNNQNQAYLALGYAPEGGKFEALVYDKKSHRGNLTMAGDVQQAGFYGPYVAENKEDLDSRFVKVAWNISPGQRLALSHFDYSMDVETGWNSLYHAVPSPTTGPVIGTRSQRDTVLTYRLAPPSQQWLNFSMSLYRTRGSYERGYAYGTDLYYLNEDRRWGFSMQNLMRFTTGRVGHRLLLGLDSENREEDALYVLNKVRSDFGSMPNRYRDSGFFVQHELSMIDNRLLVQLGGRYDRFEREVRNVRADYSGSRFSPRIGVSYEVIGGLNLLANYSRAFRAPTPHETSSSGPLNIHYWYLPNPNLKAETSSEYEVGASWRKTGLFADADMVSGKVMFFKGKIDQMINLEVDYGSVSPGNSEYAQYRNIAGVKRRGLEFESMYSQRHWGVTATYAKLDMSDARTGRKVPAFADVARIGLQWRPFDDDFEISAKYSHWFKPNQYPAYIMSGRVRYDYVSTAYNQTDIQMRWRPWRSGRSWLDDSTQLVVGATNLFDQKRLTANSVVTSTRTGLGRNFYVSLTKQF